MRSFIVILTALLSITQVKAQESLNKADQCYREKNYQCAINFYSEAISAKTYPEKNYHVIQYRIGYSYAALGKYSESIVYFQNAINSNPAYGNAHWDLAYSHYKVAAYDKAVDHYTKAIELNTDPKNLRSLYHWRGKSWSAQKKYTQALADFKMAFEKDPAYDDSYALAGDMCYNLAKYRDALNYYDQSIRLAKEISPKIMAARYYWKGRSYYKLFRYDSAMMDYNKVLELDPNYREAVWEIGAVYYNQFKWPEAIAQYTKTMTLYKNDSASMTSLYSLRGYCYRKSKDYAKAIADYDMVLKYDPTQIHAVDNKAMIFIEQKKFREALPLLSKGIEMDKYGVYKALFYAMKARCFLVLKDTASALESISNAKTYDEYGDIGEIYVESGNINFGKRKYTQAALDYDDALADFGYFEDNGYMSLIYLRKGISNMMISNLSTAGFDLEESIYYDSLNKAAHRFLGEVDYAQKKYADAEKSFTTAIRLYKNEKDSLHRMYSYRGQNYYMQKNYAKALADYEQADKLNPNNLNYLVGIAQLAFETKDFQKVVNTFTKIIPMYKPNQKNELAFAYYGRGRAFHELKNKDKALQDLNKAIELFPNYAEAKTWKATITAATY